MSTNKKGRPKYEQTKPLIFERFRSRVTRPLSMSAKTAADLDLYIEWACSEVGADTDEALTLVLDQALSQLFQRDRLFQEAVKEGSKESAATSSGTAGPTTPSGTAPQARPAVGGGNSAATTSTAVGSSSVIGGSPKGTAAPQMATSRPGTSQ